MVLLATYDTNVLTPPIQDAPFPSTFHAHTHSSLNAKINLIEVDDDIEGDNEEKCEGKRNLDDGVDLPMCGLRNHSLKKHKTLKFGKRDVLKLKKVVTPNILSPHLTLIITCFCSLEM